MTLLLAWASFDDGKDDPSAIYIATDSRISWGDTSTWDFAQKVFCVPQSMEIFGYCGDVMCVTQTLSQIVHLCSLNIFGSPADPTERINLFSRLIQEALETYPNGQIVSSSSIIYAIRFNNSYSLYEINISKDKKVSFLQFFVKRKDAKTRNEDREDRVVRGSGATEFKGKIPSETTYQAFHRFCECIDERAIPSVGGVPQVVTIRRNGVASILGVSINGENHALGLNATQLDEFSGILEWKNENFERWDPKTQRRIDGAKRQPRHARRSAKRHLP